MAAVYGKKWTDDGDNKTDICKGIIIWMDTAAQPPPVKHAPDPVPEVLELSTPLYPESGSPTKKVKASGGRRRCKRGVNKGNGRRCMSKKDDNGHCSYHKQQAHEEPLDCTPANCPTTEQNIQSCKRNVHKRLFL